MKDKLYLLLYIFDREFWKFGERYFQKERFERYVEELNKERDSSMAHKDAGVILGIHQSREEDHPRWYRETLFIQNGLYWLCCEGGPESRYECNDGRPENELIESEHALHWLETNGFEEQADTLLAINRNGWLAVDNRPISQVNIRAEMDRYEKEDNET